MVLRHKNFMLINSSLFHFSFIPLFSLVYSIPSFSLLPHHMYILFMYNTYLVFDIDFTVKVDSYLRKHRYSKI